MGDIFANGFRIYETAVAQGYADLVFKKGQLRVGPDGVPLAVHDPLGYNVAVNDMATHDFPGFGGVYLPVSHLRLAG
ncbi:hypothetical protein MothHH_01848 [Moorella thermoacetica]|nr:hypothetical protein MothHH_01848 [Moorella thermoacetica]